MLELTDSHAHIDDDDFYLRGNLGGLVTEAVGLAGRFLRNGQTVVSHRGRAEQEQIFRAKANPLGTFPVSRAYDRRRRPETYRPTADEKQADSVVRIEALLQQKADALALARRQMQITAFLEGWLFVHIPATFGLLAALTAHIVSVFIYW